MRTWATKHKKPAKGHADKIYRRRESNKERRSEEKGKTKPNGYKEVVDLRPGVTVNAKEKR